jgi:hypothetical protein
MFALLSGCSGAPDTPNDEPAATSFYEGCIKSPLHELLLIPGADDSRPVFNSARASWDLIYVDGVWVGHVFASLREGGSDPHLLARLHATADGLEVAWLDETPDMNERGLPWLTLLQRRHRERRGLDVGWSTIWRDGAGSTISTSEGWDYVSVNREDPSYDQQVTKEAGRVPGQPRLGFWFVENSVVLREIEPGPFELTEDDVASFPERARVGYVGDPLRVQMQRSHNGGRFTFEFAGDVFDENDRPTSGGTRFIEYDTNGDHIWEWSVETNPWPNGTPFILELDDERTVAVWETGSWTLERTGVAHLALINRASGALLDELEVLRLHEFDEIDSNDHGSLEMQGYNNHSVMRPLEPGDGGGFASVAVEPNELWRVSAPGDVLTIERTLTYSSRHADGTQDAINETAFFREPDVEEELVRIDSERSLEDGRLGQAAGAGIRRFASMWLKEDAGVWESETHTELVVYFQEIDCE